MSSQCLSAVSRSPSVGEIDNWNAQYWAFSTDDNNITDATYAAEVVRKDGCTLVTEGWVKNHWVGSCGSLTTLSACGLSVKVVGGHSKRC